jgi:hypothetical protein
MTKCRGDAIEMDRSDMAYQIVPISKLCGRENDRTGEEKRREEKRREEKRGEENGQRNKRYTCPMI